MYMYMYIHIHIYIYIQTMYIYVYIYDTCIYTMQTHTYMYIYIHIYIDMLLVCTVYSKRKSTHFFHRISDFTTNQPGQNTGLVFIQHRFTRKNRGDVEAMDLIDFVSTHREVRGLSTTACVDIYIYIHIHIVCYIDLLI